MPTDIAAFFICERNRVLSVVIGRRLTGINREVNTVNDFCEIPSFLHAEQVCLLAEAIASRSARYSRRIVTRDTSRIRLYASDYNNLLKA